MVRYLLIVMLPNIVNAPRRYRAAEVYLFDTCTMKCGYCWLAESGRVADASQLAPYRSLEHIEQLATFFNSRTTPQDAWNLLFTGGEPLLMPNLGRLCSDLFRHGNKVAFYTSLFVDDRQANFRFLCDASPSDVDYVMASFHPEAEGIEDVWFQRLEKLKRAGHKVFSDLWAILPDSIAWKISPGNAAIWTLRFIRPVCCPTTIQPHIPTNSEAVYPATLHPPAS